jgi:hypothetical protein
MLTRIRCTLIDVILAVVTTESWWTQAGVVGNAIITGAPILAWGGHTVINVGLAETACVSLGTYTFKRSICIDTGTPKMALCIQALIIVIHTMTT